jgi:hypothetical protein
MSSLFVTHYSPVYAAQDLSDQLLMPIGLNVVELLCSACYNTLNSMEQNQFDFVLPPYSRTKWQNENQFALWIGKDKAHYLWALKYLTSILGEINHRFPNRALPKYKDHVDYFYKFADLLGFTEYQDTKGVKAVDLNYPKHTSSNIPQEFLVRKAKNIPIGFSHSANMPITTSSMMEEVDVRWLHRFILFERYMHKYIRLHTWTERPIPEWFHDETILVCSKQKNGNPSTKLAKKLGFHTFELSYVQNPHNPREIGTYSKNPYRTTENP